MRCKPILTGLMLCISLLSCSEFKYTGERVTEGVTYQISTDLLFNPLIVQFIDPNLEKTPAGLTVEVMSSDFSGIYTLDGQLNLKPVQGILPLGVHKDELRGAAAPLEIQLTYTAPGYPVQSQSFLVRDSLPRLVMLPMTKEGSEPDADYIKTTLRLSAPEVQDLYSRQRTFSITWPRQTRLLNDKGGVVAGTAALQGAYMQNNVGNQAYLREKVTNQTLILHNGQKKKINIEALGLLSLALADRTATDLLYPISVSAQLPSSKINRITGEPLRAGDRIPVLAYIPEEDAWKMSGLAKVIQAGNRLFALTQQRALRTLAFGWPSFRDPSIASECILLLDMVADVPEPYTGVYRRDYLDTIQTSTGRDSTVLIKEEVFFSYTERPALGYTVVFPDCATGNAAGLDKFIEKKQDHIRAYFLRQDSLAFKGVRFQVEAGLFPVLRPKACLGQMASRPTESIALVIEAQSRTDGFLSYQYANINMEEYVSLEKGINEIFLPLPEDVFLLNTDARFGFSFQEQCTRLSDGIATDLCALQEGFSFNISPPFQKSGVSLSLKGETACNNPNNSRKVLRPTVPVLVREHCPGEFSPFRYLGQLTDGEFHGNVLLKNGKTYDFMMPIGESYTLLENITLEAGRSYRRGGNTVFISTSTEGALEVDLGVINIPDAVCALLSL